MALLTALALVLLSGPSAITVDPALPGALEVERRIPEAAAAITARLGPVDWHDVRIMAEPPGARTGSRVPDWAAAFALPGRGLVVLRPDRIGGYPYGTLLGVLTHELAHIAVARKAAHADLPHWFEEGLAMSIAAEPGAVDMYHVSLALLFGPGTRLDQLDQRFFDERSEVQAAYALSLSFVSWLGRNTDEEAASRIVEVAARGITFEDAVQSVTGRTLEALEADWVREVVIYYRWVPLLTSTVTLWLGITLLVFVAWGRKQRRVRELRERWEREDLELDDFDNSGPHGPN